MIAYFLMTLFLLLVDVFVIISILSLFSLSIYSWLYERDVIEIEMEDEEGNKD